MAFSGEKHFFSSRTRRRLSQSEPQPPGSIQPAGSLFPDPHPPPIDEFQLFGIAQLDGHGFLALANFLWFVAQKIWGWVFSVFLCFFKPHKNITLQATSSALTKVAAAAAAASCSSAWAPPGPRPALSVSRSRAATASLGTPSQGRSKPATASEVCLWCERALSG